MNYYLVNVFTKGENSGNQLAVVFPGKNLSLKQMQSITRDFNFSETVFIHDENSVLPQVRIFTPRSELPFAGHPTVGATWVMSLMNDKKDFHFDVPIGKVRGQIENGIAKVTFPGWPTFLTINQPVEKIISHCNLTDADVDYENIRKISTGPEFLVIPLHSHEALVKAKEPMSYQGVVRAYFIFKEAQNIFKVRMFDPSEDAATGSAACALAGYLKELKGLKTGKIEIHQGEEMNRPSQIQLEWDESIRIGGQVKVWAQGQLEL